MSLDSKQMYGFDSFVLNPAEHSLRNHGEPVSLTPKTYDLLFTLIQRQGELLSKDALMKAVWPDSFVDESNLTQHISMARRALGEAPGKPQHILTVPARGYRFATKVRVWSEAGQFATPLEEGAPPEQVSAPALVPQRRLSRLPLVLGFIATLGLVITAAVLYRNNARRTAAEPRTLAILPFRNLRNDTDSDFLSFSLADAIIGKLGSVRSVTVRPSSSVERYRKGSASFAEAKNDLHVNTLLTGAYQRDGENLRITSQLVDVPTEQILWQGKFDFQYKNLLNVQDSVAQQIVSKLALSVSPREVARWKQERQIDPLAYEYYLRGVSLYASNEFALAIRMLTKSAEIDPAYAPTWAELGRTYTANASLLLGGREEYQKARSAYEKSISLDPDGVDVKIYFANFLTDNGQVEQSVPMLRQVVTQRPDNAEAHWELGYAYRFAGLLNESVAESQEARRLDPGVKLNNSAPNGYLYLGQYQRFLDELPKHSESAFILFYQGLGEYYLQHSDRAATAFDRAYAADPTLLHARIGKSLSASIRGNPRAAVALLQDAEQTIANRGVNDPEAIYKISQGYAVAGDNQSALRVLRHSVEGGFFCYPYLNSDPVFALIRDDREFGRILDTARQRHREFQDKFHVKAQ